MEFKKITNFLEITSDNKDLPRFVTKEWTNVYDQSEGNYNVNKEVRIKTSILTSDLCGFNDAYIVVKEIITVTEPDNAKKNKAVTFKNNTPFINCISKISGIKIDNAEDLDVVVMSRYNLLEYSKNHENCYRDEPSDPVSSDSKYFKYNTSITGKTYNTGAGEGYDANKVGKNETEIVIPLNYLSNFWKSLNTPLINCEIKF